MASLEPRPAALYSSPQLLSTRERLLENPALAEWSLGYSAADPFPHIVIDGLFPDDALRQVVAEIARDEIEPEKEFYGSFRKRKTSDIARLGPAARRLIEELNGPAFLQFLEKLTGIEALVPDPYLEGGGVHQIGTGGFLKVHTDFNWHKKLSLHRRLNALLYLNEGWKEDWAGQLELWDASMTACRQRIAPLFNRLVVFSTTDTSYHGHPDPLRAPEGVYRNSVALYYYTVARPAGETAFGKSVMTNYRERPAERFEGGKLKHRIHQALIRNPLMRRLFTR